jgi:hypothetical protein
MDVSASHNTLSLDSGTRSLSSMWSIVCDDVCNAFEDTQDLGDQVVLLEVCYVKLCYVMLCYLKLYSVMLCNVMLCCVMLSYILLCCVMLCYVML